MVLRLADFFMRLEARLSYALIGLVQATGYAGGLDLPIFNFLDINNKSEPISDWIKVRIILIWWRRGESNPCPKALQQDFLRAQLRFEHSLLDAARNRRGDSVES